MKISRRKLPLEILEKICTTGINNFKPIENGIPKGSNIVYSFINEEKRELHLFFNDEENGLEISDSSKLPSIPAKYIIFIMDEK